LTPDQLTALVATGESDTLEFKRSTGERREAMHALCAMLNHRGGRVLFGVTPAGSVVGQQVSDRTLEELAQEIQSIEPPVFPDVVRVGHQAAEWEIKNDLALLKQCGLIIPEGRGRGACWRLKPLSFGELE
jgi:predicted HTH transcriptional regulator